MRSSATDVWSFNITIGEVGFEMVRVCLNPRGVAACAVLLAVGSAFLVLVWLIGRDDIKLHRTGVVATADVLDWRITVQRGAKLHELRYSFAVPGHPDRFTRGDPLAREDLWSSVVPEVWEGSRQSRQLEVRYVPEDPRINCPVAEAGLPWFDKLVVLILGVICLAWGSGLLLSGLVQYARCRRHPPTHSHKYLLFRTEPAPTVEDDSTGSPSVSRG